MSSSISQRVTYVRVDELGMDPLRDPSFEAIKSVRTYQPYTVTSETKHASDMISDMFYQTHDMWWAILYYNDLADNFALETGMRIKIPNQNELYSALTKANSAGNAPVFKRI